MKTQKGAENKIVFSFFEIFKIYMLAWWKIASMPEKKNSVTQFLFWNLCLFVFSQNFL